MSVIILGILMIGLAGCDLRTPEIQGTVLDAETKQPVEGAWVTATLEVYSKTVAGDVHQSLFVGKTWTDKEGKFVLPQKDFKKPSFSVSYGIKVEGLGVKVTSAGKRGWKSIKEYGRKESMNIFLDPLKDELKIEEGYSSEIRWLYEYCLTGRVGLAMPAVEGGCDDKELNLAIAEYERFLEQHKRPAEEGKVKGYSIYMEQLAYLYEKKGDLNKAIETLKKKIAFIEKRGLLRHENWQKEKSNIERKTNELQQKIKKNKN